MFYASGRYDEALRLYVNGYELVRQTNPLQAANFCVDIASMDYVRGDIRKAANRSLIGLQYIDREKLAPDSIRFKLYSSLGLYYQSLFRKDSSLYFYQGADALLIHNPEIEEQIPLYVLYHFNNQGIRYFKMGNYKKARKYLLNALRNANAQKLTHEVFYIVKNLSSCNEAMGRYDDALRYAIYATNDNAPISLEKSATLTSTARILIKLERYPEAIQYLIKAEQLLRRIRQGNRASLNSLALIEVWRMMASCDLATHQTARATRYIQQALTLARNQMGGQGTELARVLIEQGQLLENLLELPSAIKTYQAAIRAVSRDTTGLADFRRNPPVETAFDEAVLLLATTYKAAALKRQYVATQNRAYLDASVLTYSYCVKLQLQSRGNSAMTQPNQLLEHQPPLLSEAIATTYEAFLLQGGSALREPLFQLFEQAQVERLGGEFRSSSNTPLIIPEPLLEQEQALKEQIYTLKKVSVTDEQAVNELNSLQLRWNQLKETFRQNYPRYYRLNYQHQEMSSQSLQQQLGDETAYIAYVRHDASLYILVVTNQTFKVIRKPIEPIHFDQLIAKLSQELNQDPMLSAYEGQGFAKELYATLLNPILPNLAGKSRLVICRDFSFNSFPFEILETGKQQEDFLGKIFALSYAYSAKTFFEHPPSLSTTNPALIIAPFTSSHSTSGIRLPILPATKEEASKIGGKVLRDSYASLSNFFKTYRDHSVIYFATHAVTNDDEPESSYIHFYPGGQDKLYIDDIYNLQLASTRLAVLSACETTAGQSRQGEGILSLARAFAYAGCPSVVTTLWKANDETTSYLTIRLSYHLASGKSVDQALQAARLDFFNSPNYPKYHHPHYWANFALLGNYTPVRPKGDDSISRLQWILIVAGLFICISLVALWIRRKEHNRWIRKRI